MRFIRSDKSDTCADDIRLFMDIYDHDKIGRISSCELIFIPSNSL